MRISDWSSDVCSSDLLNAFAGNIASDRGAVALARDLIDIVDIDDALLRFFDVAVCGLQKFGDDVFDLFAYIAGLGQRGGVDHDEWQVASEWDRFGGKRFYGYSISEERRVGKGCGRTVRA